MPHLSEMFWQVSLPMMVTILAGVMATIVTATTRSNNLNKRIDDLRDSLNRRMDDMNRTLERIEAKLDNHDQRITVLEERTSPFRR